MKSFVEESNTKVEDIMATNVVSLDISKIASHAADLMTEKRIGSIIITKNNKPFGIITERDLVRRYARDTPLEGLASHPLITAERNTTVEKVVKIMLKNGIRKIPIVDQNNDLVGIVTITDLVKFLLPKIKTGLAFSILQTVTRGKGPKCDSCGSYDEIQWCDSCNRFMCLTCEDEVHTIDLP
jgi:CBS domain-containing protein